jgi:hypothetical protein
LLHTTTATRYIQQIDLLFFIVLKGDDPYSSTDIRACIGVSADKGIIWVDNVDNSIAFNTDSRGKYLEVVGNISILNEVFKTFMYETARNESGLVTVLVRVVKEYCHEDKFCAPA